MPSSGLDNYVTILGGGDPYFWKAMQVTFSWVLLTVPLFMITGLGIALLLNQKLRGMHVFRTLLYIPAVLSGVAVAVLWFVLLNGEFGAVNQLLRASASRTRRTGSRTRTGRCRRSRSWACGGSAATP